MKPNTRFLRNILRDTDSHNASLRRQAEREQSQICKHSNDHGRTRHANNDRSRSRSRSPDPHAPSRHRAPATNPAKRRLDDSDKEHSTPRKTHRHSRSNRSPSSSRHTHHTHHLAKHHLSQSSNAHDSGTSRHESRSHRHRHHHHHHHRRRHHSPEQTSKSTNKPPAEEQTTHHHHHHHRKQHSPLRQEIDGFDSPGLPAPSPEESSDTSDELIGPAPPSTQRKLGTVTSRGRGVSVFKKHSSIDDHFDPHYDPRIDHFV